MSKYLFYIGTHTPGDQPSIHKCEADFAEQSFTTLCTMQGIPDPTYLAGPTDGVLYTLGKTPDGGSVFALRETSEGLIVINSLPSGGQGPCHISLDPRGEFLLCANYGSGSAALYDLNDDGSLHSLCDVRQYSGVGYDSTDRQKGPHAHFATFHRERDEVLVCDLGLDMVYVYELDRKGKKLRDTDRSIKLPDGSGPRHLIFHEAHPGMLFVITEMANTIFTYRFNPDSCRYICEQQITAVPDSASPDGVAASREDLMVPPTADNGSIGCAIRFSADGKYLFVSSRLGYQSISAFRCDEDGKLHFCDRCLSGGITQRDFNIFPGAKDEGCDYILTANQDSGLVTALKFDRKSGKLTLLDMKIQAVKPTCILPVVL